jgi:O-antigen/teichoic acid export membrane protein
VFGFESPLRAKLEKCYNEGGTLDKYIAACANSSSAQAEARGSWRMRTAKEGWKTRAEAVADQVVVSGTSFVTTIMIARFCPPSALGVYSMGISLLVSSVGIQDSLISAPYTIRQHNPLGTRAEHVGSSLINCGLLSALAMVVLMTTAIGLSAYGALPELVPVIWALAGVVPFVLLREFDRRLAFAHLHTVGCLMLDLTVAAIQLAALGLLAWTGQLSPATASAAIGAACAVAGGVWLYRARENMDFQPDQVWATMERDWGLGKWLLAAQVTSSVQGYVTYWLLAWLAGPAATGVFTACMSVVLFVNPLMLGLGLIFTPRAVLAFKEGGVARLRRQTIRESMLVGAAMTLFCALVMFAGEAAMRLLYSGKVYQGHGHTITVLALALLATSVGMPVTGALSSIERPRANLWANLCAAVVTICLVSWFVVGWSLLGAAYGVLGGNVAGTVVRWVAFLTLAPNGGGISIAAGETEAAPLTLIGAATSCNGPVTVFGQVEFSGDILVDEEG